MQYLPRSTHGLVSSPLLSQSSPGYVGFNLWFVSYTILVFDLFCTLDIEINYVWTCQWMVGLVLFYLNRYLPLLDIAVFLHPLIAGPISQDECKWIFPMAYWLVTFGLIISQSVIILRTYALWGRRPLVFWILTPIATITFSSMLAVTCWKTFIDYRRLQTFSLPDVSIPPGVRCQLSALSFDRGGKLTLLIFYLLVFLGEAGIMVLTVIKAQRHVSKSSPQWVSQLYKNGIFYCGCMLALSLVNCLVTFTAPAQYKSLFIPLQRTLHSVFCTRTMLLILRHRNRDRPPQVEHQPGSASRTMDMFTSINVVSDIYTDDSDACASWQMRADREWVE